MGFYFLLFLSMRKESNWKCYMELERRQTTFIARHFRFFISFSWWICRHGRLWWAVSNVAHWIWKTSWQNRPKWVDRCCAPSEENEFERWRWLPLNGSGGFWKTNGGFGGCQYCGPDHGPSHNADPRNLIDHEQSPIYRRRTTELLRPKKRKMANNQ